MTAASGPLAAHAPSLTAPAPDRAERLGKTVPIGREGTADEVAEGVVWLLSDEASYVAGAVLDITGGR